MNSTPVTVRSSSMAQGSRLGEVEALRRTQNFLVQMVAALMNGVLTDPGLARGTTATKVKTTATTTFRSAGAIASHAAVDDLWTLTGSVVPVSKFQKFILCYDGSTASVIPCVAAATDAGVKLPNYQALTSPVFGVLVIATDASHTFTPGTTALNATGITATFRAGWDNTLSPTSLVKTTNPDGPGS